MKLIRWIRAQVKCAADRDEERKHYCTSKCTTCGYGDKVKKKA